jgi:hypothetical protein
MKLRTTLLALAVLAVAVPQVATAKKNDEYIANNHRFNSVMLKEIKQKEAEKLGIMHPQQVDVQGLKAALASINLSRSYIIKKEVDSQRVFGDGAVDFLSVNLSRAFSQATSNQIVEFSYLQKEPIFILRNDRLNLGKVWLASDGLHIVFDKLYSKITGDVDARGHEGQAIARSKGLRVHLDVGPGQQMSLDNPDEVIVDLHYNFAEALQKKKDEPPPPAKTIAGEEAPAPETAAAPKADDKKVAKKGKKSEPVVEAAPTPAALTPSTTEQRMKALDQMRKDGLISKKEYEAKKKEILQGL